MIETSGQAESGAAERIDQALFSKTDAQMTTPIRSSSILAFVATWEAFQFQDPTDPALTEDDLHMMCRSIEDTAQSIYLNELATW